MANIITAKHEFSKFYGYRFEKILSGVSQKGRLNGIDKAVALLFYPQNAFGNKNTLREFVCSDSDLSDEGIHTHYTYR